ncbi:MAG TPA: hypothetical protein VNE82_15700 [Candidatus Binataceae bacterium]|nr:hypothetical protein [Candidatus Binataceae bacterium]
MIYRLEVFEPGCDASQIPAVILESSAPLMLLAIGDFIDTRICGSFPERAWRVSKIENFDAPLDQQGTEMVSVARVFTKSLVPERKRSRGLRKFKNPVPAAPARVAKVEEARVTR